ncbi:MAG: type II toxin-antitoxin system VapC family toxin [Gammaproteobacteria bacterium]
MIILDTNIISEMMKQSPTLSVITWVNSQKTANLYITSITIGEIEYGIQSLPVSRRRKTLENAFNKVIKSAFSHRILSFDESSAYVYGELMSHRKHLGLPLSILDGQIAAIAISNQFALATRNTKDFTECSIELINPFD